MHWFNFSSSSRSKRVLRGFLVSASVGWSVLCPLGTDHRLGAEDRLENVRATSFRSVHEETQRERSVASRRSRETPTVTAIRRASPAVVNLHGQKTVRTAAAMAGAVPDTMRQVNGMGTGVVIDPRGYVITNFHVVDNVDEINVTLQDGRNTRADLVASDPESDLALVKLQGEGPFETIPRGKSNDLMVGETVIAIGNAFGYVHTSTQGIISALHRDVPVNETQSYRDLIQTSAGINPGNSGGPLLNINGEMIGVNVAVRVGAQQIAFAIPIDQVMDTVTEMVRRDNERRLSLGLAGETNGSGGYRLTSVRRGSAAESCGLKRGDVLVMADSIPVGSELEFALTLLDTTPSHSLRLEFERGDQRYETDLAIGANQHGTDDPAAALAWQVLGIAVRPAGEALTSQMNARLRTSYRGGLIVTAVRAGSIADQQRILVGDMLLGIHSWQTASLADLAGILEHPEIRQGTRAKFYLVRRDQTLYGHMQLAAQNYPTRR